MLRSSALALLVAGLAPAAAHAEFALQATPSSRDDAAPSPVVLGESAPQSWARAAVPVALITPIASGFGKEVPLRFAVRQIVPPGWRVRYGPGVDPDRPVTWQGGRAWDRVLVDAVKPAGLRAAPVPGAPRAVLIGR